jgi:hypothetical protein
LGNRGRRGFEQRTLCGGRIDCRRRALPLYARFERSDARLEHLDLGQDLRVVFCVVLLGVSGDYEKERK